MSAATTIPAHPSNRHVLDRAAAWGATVTGRSKGLLRLRTPSGATFRLQPATIRTGNSPDLLAACARACAGSTERFWQGTPPPLPPKDLKALKSTLALVPAPAPVSPPTHPPTTTKKDHVVTPRPALPAVAAAPEATPTPPTPAKSHRPNQVHRKVLDVLQAHAGAPVTVDRIASSLGLTGPSALGTVSTSAARWVKAPESNVERVARGVYVYRQALDAVEAVEAPEVAPEAPAATPAPVVPAVDTDTTESLMADFLAMLLPHGLKVSDLAAVDAWREATRTLVQQVAP